MKQALAICYRTRRDAGCAEEMSGRERGRRKNPREGVMAWDEQLRVAAGHLYRDLTGAGWNSDQQERYVACDEEGICYGLAARPVQRTRDLRGQQARLSSRAGVYALDPQDRRKISASEGSEAAYEAVKIAALGAPRSSEGHALFRCPEGLFSVTCWVLSAP